MEHDQRVEMVSEMRELRRTGNVSEAAKIQAALDNNEFLVEEIPEPKPKPKQPSKQAKIVVWAAYAKEISEIDHEVLDGSSRKDIIGMLDANGLLD